MLAIILFLPFLLTFLISGESACPLYKPPDMEKYLPAVVYLQIPYSHHLENIRAQTILARTNIDLQLEKGTPLYTILKRPLEYLAHEQGILHFIHTYKRFIQAARDTRGQILTYQGQKVVLPYCAVTTGKTRDGTSLLHSRDYAYLVSVDTPQDRQADDYISSVYCPGTDYHQEIEILTRDAADYVLTLKAGDEIISGESLRRTLGLPSSAFTLQMVNGQTRFLCRGQGHGLGFSQYGGNVLAAQGKSCDEILRFYFPLLTLSSL